MAVDSARASGLHSAPPSVFAGLTRVRTDPSRGCPTRDAELLRASTFAEGTRSRASPTEVLRESSVRRDIDCKSFILDTPSRVDEVAFSQKYHSVRQQGSRRGLLIVAFVNSRSGGGLGSVLLDKLRVLLADPAMVCDLALADEPRATLTLAKESAAVLRFFVCGGDGTVQWLLSEIHAIGLDPQPPIAIAPTGTGNDLARSLGWGGYFRLSWLSKYLSWITDDAGEAGKTVALDQWRASLFISPDDAEAWYRDCPDDCPLDRFVQGDRRVMQPPITELPAGVRVPACGVLPRAVQEQPMVRTASLSPIFRTICRLVWTPPLPTIFTGFGSPGSATVSFVPAWEKLCTHFVVPATYSHAPQCRRCGEQCKRSDCARQ
mmetsp:Transcript_21194/g.54029  ORF Transcript_21194/g.54029 Transcript_21194/m.54029 type:complete len:377 (+) Transcript_21194:41-1171(+)